MKSTSPSSSRSSGSAAPPVQTGARVGPGGSPTKPVRLLDQLRERVRYLHYSWRTEEAYVYWVKAFIHFHGTRHPREMGPTEVERFLSHLANERKVSASTHKQALSALLFLYKQVLGVNLPWLGEIGRPKTERRLPVVLSRDEVAQLLHAFDADYRLIAQLLYGAGLRLLEGLRLRVKDLDFDHGAIIVREGKGRKDRTVMLPDSLVQPLRSQLQHARLQWERDRQAGVGAVFTPDALATKYPCAGETWGWFWLFPAGDTSVDSRTGEIRRHHVLDQIFLPAQGRRWGCAQPAGCAELVA